MNPAVFLSLPDVRCSLLLLVTWVFTPVTTEITSLDTENIDEILNNADVALVNFYADWLRKLRFRKVIRLSKWWNWDLTQTFSIKTDAILNMNLCLNTCWAETGQSTEKEPWTWAHPDQVRGNVNFVVVVVVLLADIAQRYRISKYPTLKLFRNGMMMKREYRGQRSVKALADYIRQQKSDPIQEIQDLAEITTLDRSKRNIIGYFEQKDSDNYRIFERVASILHDDCAFLSAFGDVSKPERYSGDNIIYKPPGHSAPDMVYLGSMTNFDLTYNWIQDKCVPLVREITFENGEELTEEGLPFLILFHMKEDTESLEIFQTEVARQLISEKGTINFLHADCDKFRHPLLHIQKTPADCPVIAIDSFRHMYVFGDFQDVLIPGKLKQFVFDLHSGKLHREFHHGPDPTDTAPGEQVQDIASSPPESSFQKLAPSEYRYTLLRDRDEL
ncbi:endoplasmic reticulum resident protein 44 [Marmota marmota marmota]|nr:endoplasmic reticulum resident protein 44 [Marmota marmota marmota]